MGLVERHVWRHTTTEVPIQGEITTGCACMPLHLHTLGRRLRRYGGTLATRSAPRRLARNGPCEPFGSSMGTDMRRPEKCRQRRAEGAREKASARTEAIQTDGGTGGPTSLISRQETDPLLARPRVPLHRHTATRVTVHLYTAKPEWGTEQYAGTEGCLFTSTTQAWCGGTSPSGLTSSDSSV